MAFRQLLRGRAKRPFGYEATDERGVPYWFVPQPPSATGTAGDRIVAAAAQLAGEAQVVILTADASMEMTALLAGMEVVPVPPEMLEQEVAQLKREVTKLPTPQPLDVAVRAVQLWPPDAPAALRRLGLSTYEQLAEIQRSLPARMSRRGPGTRASRALETYHSELPAYAEAVASYLATLAHARAGAPPSRPPSAGPRRRRSLPGPRPGRRPPCARAGRGSRRGRPGDPQRGRVRAPLASGPLPRWRSC
jgi:hypothetical protein